MSLRIFFRLCCCIFTAHAFFWLQGCNYLSIPAHDNIIRKPVSSELDNRQGSYNSAVIKGRILFTGKTKDATLVVAWRAAPNEKGFSGHVIVGNQGSFMLYLPEGRYHLYAVTDYNHNGIYEQDEVSGVYGTAASPAEIVIREGELVTGITIKTINDSAQHRMLPEALSVKEQDSLTSQQTFNGQVLKIYSDYFSLQNAQSGYWNPTAFMKTFGANIYLAQTYDPRKIPVLFVHGTEGSPHNWIYFYMRLDHSRYQMWHYYYPSGIRLPLAASLLDEAINELRRKYGFSRMALVAHSVGGLATRSFLTRFTSNGQNDFIKLYVTFATPWSGFGMADASQVVTHKSIPAWLDLGTQSAFIKKTLDAKLPPHVRHYLFYGKQDQLAAEAALDTRAVSCAVKTLGWDCSHDSILSDRTVFAAFADILNREFNTAK
ncbi:MAG: alpha/beta hydrolase [Smithellaceae bacterium]